MRLVHLSNLIVMKMKARNKISELLLTLICHRKKDISMNTEISSFKVQFIVAAIIGCIIEYFREAPRYVRLTRLLRK